MKRTYVVASAIVAIAIIAISVGYYYYVPKPGPTPAPTVVMGTTLDIETNLDPHQDFSPGILDLNYVVFDPLFEVPPGLYPEARLVPRLAAGDPVVSEDGLHWTIALQRGVMFHDGTPFNATAMKFSLDRVKQLNSYPAFLLDAIDTVEVVDLYTIRLNLKYADAALVGQLSMPVAAPVSPSAVQKMGLEAFQQLPVGTGPFMYVNAIKGDRITLAPFEDYWNKTRIPQVKLVYKIYADSATLKLALEKGEIDTAWNYVAMSDYETLLSNPDIKHGITDETYNLLLTVNMGIPGSPLQDVRVRRAVAFSIDQQEISEKVYNSVYTPKEDTLFNPGFYPKPSWLRYEPTDVTKAKELLTEAGYPNGIDVEMWYTPVALGKEFPDVAVLIKEQLERAGIRVALKSAEVTTFFTDFRAGVYEMALCQMSPDFLDPDAVARFIADSNGSYSKRVHLNDTSLDEFVADGVATIDATQREKIYGDIQDRLAELCVYIPLVHRVTYWFYRSNISGVTSFYLEYSPFWLIAKQQS